MLALMFPGQGSQGPEMVAGLTDLPEFEKHYALVCQHAGADVLEVVASGRPDILNENLVSSLMTVLVSSLSLHLFRDHEREGPPFALAGYSVGQWMALHAAGVIDFEQLVGIIAVRARLMSECIQGERAGMAAVIGLSEEEVEGVLADLRAAGHSIFISNYNCRGQYSISGSELALAEAEGRLRALRPRKWVRLPVSGPWHCPMLSPAAERFRVWLSHVELQPARLPVIDNVTGEWLPTEAGALRDALARHLSHPVRWHVGIRTLCSGDCSKFVEVGYGETLCKFMFFIDRSVETSAFHVRRTPGLTMAQRSSPTVATGL